MTAFPQPAPALELEIFELSNEFQAPAEPKDTPRFDLEIIDITPISQTAEERRAWAKIANALRLVWHKIAGQAASRTRALFAHLQRLSRSFSYACGGAIDQDDITQEMALVLHEFERANRPDMSRYNDAYLKRRAYLCGAHLIRGHTRKEKRIAVNLDAPRLVTGPGSEIDELGDCVTMIAADDETPEQAFSRAELRGRVVAVIRNLDERSQKICYMIANGYQDTEIAQVLGVSKSAISHRKRDMRALFAGAVAA